jgi:hypothetical protein
MPCSVVKLADGTVAIVRHARRRLPKCGFCNMGASLLCDAIVGQTLGGESITCDSPVCVCCARQVGPDKDFCPKHSQFGGK